MSDTTIKISEDVRVRLGELAAEQGWPSVRAYLENIVRTTPTEHERRAALERGMAYVRQHLAPHITDEDIAHADALRDQARRGELGEVV